MRREFLQEAKSLADHLRQKDQRLIQEQKELERQLNQIKSERKLISDVEMRLIKYASGPDNCPVCYMLQGASNALKLVSSEGQFDNYQCPKCSYSVKVESRERFYGQV